MFLEYIFRVWKQICINPKGCPPLTFINPSFLKGCPTLSLFINPKVFRGCPPLAFINPKVFRGCPPLTCHNSLHIVHSQKKLTNNNFNCRWFRRKNQRKIKLNDRLHDDFVLFLCARAHTHVFMIMLAFVPSLSVKCHQSVSTNFYTIAGGKVLLYTLLLTGLEGSTNHAYRKVASSRPVYYSISDSLGQRTQYISVKFPLHKQSENTARDFTVYI